MTRRIVLDTNIAAFAPLAEIAELQRFGLPISVSEVAVSETWARSTRSVAVDGVDTQLAKGKLVRRFPKLAPYLDPDYPVALAGLAGVVRASLMASARAQVEPRAFAEFERAMRAWADYWQLLMGGELSDEQWMHGGQACAAYLSSLDAKHAFLARSLDEKLRDRYQDPEERAAAQAELDAADPDDVRRFSILAIRAAIKKATIVDISERLDAYIGVTTWRAVHAEEALARPEENAGADHRLLVHLAEGAVVLTNDERLCALVDATGSPQAPWVQRAKDIAANGMPTGDSWGPSAATQARRLRREGLARHARAWDVGLPPYGEPEPSDF